MSDDPPAATPAGWFSAEAATFGDRVTGAREAAGLTRRELASRLGVKLSSVASWEDDLADPRANKLKSLAGILGVSIRWLLTGEGEGLDGPPDSEAPRGQAAPLLAEVRALRTEMMTMAERLGRLEKRLRVLASETSE
ncbi:helix-turn-helix domain-containing protein [Frigidibacter oleivorans]|uniref:helix-turn-helix domain-containing protein n=1 Tax=Frigidibacter oleivorans TaxID=2487129 RepID=UPI000F8DD96C|nr:helix-turn-helix transcriptional regulator [Frigidibacter oleivorans]